jgi:transcriptional regulator with XRE-family HTH domain
MDTTELWNRIQERLTATRQSARGASLRAGLKADAIRTIRRGHTPRRETLRSLAAVLECPLSYLESAAPDLRIDSRADDAAQDLRMVLGLVHPAKRRDFIEAVRLIAQLTWGPQESEGSPAPAIGPDQKTDQPI